jgi:hypothetical protein
MAHYNSKMCSAECRNLVCYTECRHAECRYAECRHAECCSTRIIPWKIL